MPFIGKNPTAGFASIVKDDLTGNGTTGPYTLSKQVANANDIAVFVGNVRQEPTDAYTVNGNQLTMTGTVSSSINFYVLHIAGTHESSVVPADGTISSAKIVSGAVTGAKLASGAAVANISTGGIATAKLADGAVSDVKLDQTLGTMVKLANIDVANNTSAQLMFHSVLNGPYQVYKIIGKIGGTTNTGNANMALRWVTGTGVDISGGNYYSANYGSLSDGNFNIGYSSGANDRAYILVHTATGISNFVEMTLIPSIAYGYGFIHTHDQNTDIGMTNFGFKYNSSFSDISGVKIFPSGGNMTLVDATVYGMKLSGSLGG